MSDADAGARGTMVVIGGGTMGRGIALTAVSAGYDVRLVDADATARQKALDYVEAKAAGAAGGGTITVGDELAAAVEGATVVIEAVPEIMELKRQIFATLGHHASPTTLLATNTSTLSIAPLAEAAGGSSRVIGMHFFNPAHRMALVELVVGSLTSEKTRADAIALCHHLGKDPIVVRDEPGFVTSRLGLLLGNEAMRIVQEGTATAGDVDKALRLGYNHPMGPLELADLVGLDARLNNVRSIYASTRRADFEPPQILVDLVEAGRLGRKSGAGFYDYDETGRRIDAAPSATP